MRSENKASFFLTHHPLLLAIASGALSALSIVFPALFFLIWMAFVPLFVSLRGGTVGTRLLLGFTTGLAYFGGAYHWVWWSMTQLSPLEWFCVRAVCRGPSATLLH